MVLTPDQQAQLDQLEAEKKKPEPRTDTGLAGVLHVLLDVASGNLAHLGADAWAALHSIVEKELGGSTASGSSGSKDSKPGK